MGKEKLKRSIFYELSFLLLIFSTVPNSVIADDNVNSNVLIDLEIGSWIVNPTEFTGSVEITYVGAPSTAIKINKIEMQESSRLLFEKNVMKELSGAGENHTLLNEFNFIAFDSPEYAIKTYEELERIVANSTHKEYLPIEPEKIFGLDFTPGTRKNVTFVVEFEYQKEIHKRIVDYNIGIRLSHPRPPFQELQSNVSGEDVSILAVHPAANWYLGDLHVHSTYTDCDFLNPDRSISQRKQRAKSIDLDWLSITDHSYCFGDTDFFDPITPWDDWNNMRDEAIANTDSNFVIMPSEELSVREKCPSSNTEEDYCRKLPPQLSRGVGAHLGSHNLNTYIGNEPGDHLTYRCPSSPLQDDAINNVNGQGGLSIINHPSPIPNDITGSVMWDWESCFDENDCTTGETGIEIWSGPYDIGDGRAIDIWKRELLEGKKIYGYAGSDTEGGLLGDVFVANAVYVSGTFNLANLGDALKQGHHYITNDPALVLWGYKTGDQFDYSNHLMGNTITVTSGSQVTLKIYYDTNGRSGALTLYKGTIGGSESIFETRTVSGWGDEFFYDIPTSTSNIYYRARFASSDGAYLAYTNPIWVNVDASPPSITSIHAEEATNPFGIPAVYIKSAIADPSGIAQAHAIYKIPGSAYASGFLPMQPSITGEYSTGGITGLPGGANLKLGVCAQDNAGNAFCELDREFQMCLQYPPPSLQAQENGSIYGALVAPCDNTKDHSYTVGCTDTDPPPKPALNPLTSPDYDGEYTVSWNAVNDTGCAGLQKYELEETSASGLKTSYNTSQAAYLITGKGVGTYTYRVRAWDGAGNDGLWSDAASISVEIQPSRPPSVVIDDLYPASVSTTGTFNIRVLVTDPDGLSDIPSDGVVAEIPDGAGGIVVKKLEYHSSLGRAYGYDLPAPSTPGTYSIKVIVTDRGGKSGSDEAISLNKLLNSASADIGTVGVRQEEVIE